MRKTWFPNFPERFTIYRSIHLLFRLLMKNVKIFLASLCTNFFVYCINDCLLMAKLIKQTETEHYSFFPLAIRGGLLSRVYFFIKGTCLFRILSRLGEKKKA